MRRNPLVDNPKRGYLFNGSGAKGRDQGQPHTSLRSVWVAVPPGASLLGPPKFMEDSR